MKKLVLTLLLLVALGLIASTAIGSKGGKNCGGSCSKQAGAVDPVAEEIQKRYADSYAAITGQLMAKQEEIGAAWGNETTTVGEINRLRNEMLELKKEYLILNDKAQREYAEAMGEYAEAMGETVAQGYGNCANGKAGCGKQAVTTASCAKQGKACGVQNKANCQAAADCPNRESCDKAGYCMEQGDARCGDCPNQ